jgi:hypothetical protein
VRGGGDTGQEKKAAHQLYQDVVLRRLERLKAELEPSPPPQKQRRPKREVV